MHAAKATYNAAERVHATSVLQSFFMVILAVTVLCYSRSVLLASLLLTKICLRSYVPIWEEYSLGF